MRIFRLIVLTSIATLVLEISSAAPAQQPHVTSEQVMHAVQEVEKLAQKQIDQNAVPGLAIAVVFQDKVVYAKGFGVRDANTKAFKRVSTPERTSQSSLPTPASDNFAGLIDIGGGRKMHLECGGSGSPTVILESGYRNDADIWSTELEPGMSPVFSQVAKFTRVCAYDRPGTFLDVDHLGRSRPVPMPRTARDLVSDLHDLLQTAHVPGPYVFAAHSFGGIFARLYASTYPSEVVGMVLVDALSEKVRTGLTPEQWKLYVNFGFTKPTPGLEKYKDIETLDVNASLDQMEKAASVEPLRSMPLFVLTQGQPFDLSPWQPLPADFPGALNKAWHAAQDALATLAPNTKHKIATKSSHYIQTQEPQLVIDAIKQVVEAVRNPATWTTRLDSPFVHIKKKARPVIVNINQCG